MGKTAPSNLTVNAALFETVRCELNDAEEKLYTAENTIESLGRVVNELQDELDTVQNFQDALDTEVEFVEAAQEPEALDFEPKTEQNEVNAEERESMERCLRMLLIDFYEDHLRYKHDYTEGMLDAMHREFFTVSSSTELVNTRDKRREKHIRKQARMNKRRR
jgi:hypothetical protein